MKKQMWVWVIIIVLALGLGYIYKHQIKLMLLGAYGNQSNPTPTSTLVSTKTGSKGSYLVGSNGMALYTFDKDTNGVSNCSGACIATWPPYSATLTTNLPANLTVITRSDGAKQYAYKGMPVYYYVGDKNTGDTNGDGFKGIWHLVKP